MENCTPDHFFACMDPPLPSFDGVRDGHVIPMDPDDPSKGGATVRCATASYVCPGGPGYDMFAGKVKAGGNDHTSPYDEQSDDFAYAHGAPEPAWHYLNRRSLLATWNEPGSCATDGTLHAITCRYMPLHSVNAVT